MKPVTEWKKKQLLEKAYNEAIGIIDWFEPKQTAARIFRDHCWFLKLYRVENLEECRQAQDAIDQYVKNSEEIIGALKKYRSMIALPVRHDKRIAAFREAP